MTTRETDPRPRAPYVDEFDVEQEVDFGRYWRALVHRWWLVLIGLVVGAIVGFGATVGGGHGFESTVTVYLGQPYAPGGTNAIESLPTRLTFVDQLLHSRAWTRKVGLKVGIKPAILSKNTTTENAGGTAPNGKSQLLTPLVGVKVTDASARLANAAAAGLAQQLVTFFNGYPGTKLHVYLTRQSQLGQKEKVAQDKLNHLQAQYNQIQNDPKISPLDRYFLLTSIYNQQTVQEQRLANFDQQGLALQEVIVLAKDVELPRIVEPASAERVPGPSKRVGVAVGAVIGAILGILAALLWEPVARRVRSRPEP
jgi:uncharacterized protein involved in exopolysaccharide biosynthesis